MGLIVPYIGLMKTAQIKITFSEPQRAWLNAEAMRLGLSVAELVRRILDQHREQREKEAV